MKFSLQHRKPELNGYQLSIIVMRVTCILFSGHTFVGQEHDGELVSFIREVKSCC